MDKEFEDKEFEERELNKIEIENNIKKLVGKTSPREFQVLYFLYLGYTQNKIADLLGIRKQSVKNYIKRIKVKYIKIEVEDESN